MTTNQRSVRLSERLEQVRLVSLADPNPGVLHDSTQGETFVRFALEREIDENLALVGERWRSTPGCSRSVDRRSGSPSTQTGTPWPLAIDEIQPLVVGAPRLELRHFVHHGPRIEGTDCSVYRPASILEKSSTSSMIVIRALADASTVSA